MRGHTTTERFTIVLAGALLVSAGLAWGQPSLVSVNPSTGPTQGGTTITLLGSGFSGASPPEPSIGGNACPPSFVSDSEIRCTLPEGQGTDQTVQVVVDGQNSNAQPFDYHPPLLNSVTPTSGPTTGGTRLTIQGENFGLSASASVGANACGNVAQTHSQLLCDAPPGTGEQPVQVNVDGQVSNTLSFTYTEDVPAASWIGLALLIGLLAWFLTFRRQRAA